MLKLIQHILIINFLDDYFLTHIQNVEDLCSKRRARFISFVKWDMNIVKCIETYPEIQIQDQHDVGDLRCRVCFLFNILFYLLIDCF